MKKQMSDLKFGILLFLILMVVSYIGWYLINRQNGHNLFLHTPEIKIILIDKESNQPIKGAILRMKWAQRNLGPANLIAFGGSIDRIKDEKWFMSNNKGEVVIPKMREFDFLWGFDMAGIKIWHPYYENVSDWLINSHQEYMLHNLMDRPSVKYKIAENQVTIYLSSLKVILNKLRCDDPFETKDPCAINNRRFTDFIFDSSRYFYRTQYLDIQKMSKELLISRDDGMKYIMELSRIIYPQYKITEKYKKSIESYYQ